MYFVTWENYPLKNTNQDRLVEEFLTHKRDKIALGGSFFLNFKYQKIKLTVEEFFNPNSSWERSNQIQGRSQKMPKNFYVEYEHM